MSVSVPGKLFVAGEYAVTRGGTAVVAAVTRRLACHARARAGHGSVVLRHGSTSWTIGHAPGSADSAPAGLRFVSFAAWLASRVLGIGDLDVELETSSSLDAASEKTGLGGSAAATAATVSALWAVAGRDPVGEGTRRERIVTGVLAHRAAQGGGSAADVVASTCGGLARIAGLDGLPSPRTLDEAAACLPGAGSVEVESLRLPAGLRLEAVGTGRAARSGPRASRFGRGFSGPERSVLAAWSEEMESATCEFADALRGGSAESARRAFAASGRLLERLAPILSMPVLSRRLRIACEVARRQGAVARISGAGGGDCAIALVREDRVVDLRRRWADSGLDPLAVGIDEGPRVESVHRPGDARG